MSFSRSALLVLVFLASFARFAPAQDKPLEMRPAIGRAGAGFYEPHHWGLVRSTIGNNDTVDREPLLTMSLAGTSQVQFTKRLWLPAKSELTTLTPVRLTGLPPGAERGIEANAAMIIETGGREEVAVAEIGMLPVRPAGFNTGVMVGPDDPTSQVSTALREAAGLTPTAAYLPDADLPVMSEAWASIDALVFSRGDAQLSPAQLETVRRWLASGGRLWINLQRVDPALARALVGDSWKVAVIDRVPLNEFTIESADGRADRRVEIKRDYPLEFVRVHAPAMEVLHRVNGYPASLRSRVGEGQLLVTTLEAPAWVNDAGDATEALKALTWFARSNESDTPDEVPAEILRGMATQQIGYSVMGRGPVLAVLGAFTLALLVGGLLLAQRDNLAHLGWVAPVLAGVAAVVLLGMGVVRQSEVPFTAASAELIEAVDGEPFAKVNSLLSIYTPPGADRSGATLKGAGPVAWPDLNVGSGATLRLVWSGNNEWEYTNLPFREGAVQLARMKTIAPLAEPAVATVRLGENGLAGSVRSDRIGALEDAVIVTPTGKLATAAGEEGGFTTGDLDELGPDQFFAGGLLGQRQMTRQAYYRQLLSRPGFPARPMLLGWSPGLDMGVRVSAQAETPGQALVIMPLVVEPAKAGERVSVPSPLMSMRTFREDKRFMSSPVYDERNGEWVDNVSTAQTVLMKFTMPEAVAGLKPESVRLAVDLATPGRPYELVVYRQQQAVPVRSGVNATGEVLAELTGETLPEVQPDGSVVVGVRIGEPTDPLQHDSWAIRSMQVSVKGVMGGSSNQQQQQP